MTHDFTAKIDRVARLDARTHFAHAPADATHNPVPMAIHALGRIPEGLLFDIEVGVLLRDASVAEARAVVDAYLDDYLAEWNSLKETER